MVEKLNDNELDLVSGGGIDGRRGYNILCPICKMPMKVTRNPQLGVGILESGVCPGCGYKHDKFLDVK